MSNIVCYTPTYSPDTEADINWPRPYTHLTQEQIFTRIDSDKGRVKPWMYMDSVDSVLNIRPDIKLVVADGRSTDSIREHLQKHHDANNDYELKLYPEKMSQWAIFNDIFNENRDADYFIYSSSDIIWHMDWVAEAIKEFEKNLKLQILFPCVNRGDPNLPSQVSPSARNLDPILPPYQKEARASVLNAYVMIFRMDFLRKYNGYPTLFRNCFTESFLSYMCEAIGGEMRILPRGHVFHHGEGDKWLTPGSAYYYTEEKMTFQNIMDSVLMHKAMGRMTVDFLKKTLYK